jgi:hypothetical protein
MSSNYMQEAIKQDWENRDYIESVSLNILKIAEFLNKFGKSVLQYIYYILTCCIRTKYKSEIGRIESKTNKFGT